MSGTTTLRWRVPAQYPQRDLPIAPYVLGAWLGDGTSTTAEITSADREVLEEIEMAGYAVSKTRTRHLVYRIGGAGHTRDAVSVLLAIDGQDRPL